MRILFGEGIGGVGDGDRESLLVEARAVANVVGCIFTDRAKQLLVTKHTADQCFSLRNFLNPDLFPNTGFFRKFT